MSGDTSLCAHTKRELCAPASARPTSRDGADLRYSSTHVIGIGIRGEHSHGSRCWLYFPEGDCPFYRATVFSNYAPGNTPPRDTDLPTLFLANDVCELMSDAPHAVMDRSKPAKLSGVASPSRPGPYWSLMLEVTESPFLDRTGHDFPVAIGSTGRKCPSIVLEAIQGALNTGLLERGAEIVSVFHERLERGYPTPSLERDDGLKELLPALKKKGVWSRGRFGAWKYEVANQDHSCMQGVQAVDNILFGAMETTVDLPDVTNGQVRFNADMHFSAPE
jgi:hypothetical protein